MHKLTILVSCIVLMTATKALADLTPDEVRDRYPMVSTAPCTDEESGERGHCYLFWAGNGYYLVFVQDREPVFMRYMEPPEPYETVWRSRPAGIAL